MAKLLYQGHGSYRITADDGRVLYVDPYAGEGYDKPADIVLITHDNSIAVRAQRIIRLQDGRIIYDGPSDDPRAVVQPSEAGEGDTL